MLNINQNFDLKAPVFNFDRDYFNSVEELEAYDTSNVPNHFVTNVAGMLYLFTDGLWLPVLSTERGSDESYILNLCGASLYSFKDNDQFYSENLFMMGRNESTASINCGRISVRGELDSNLITMDATDKKIVLFDEDENGSICIAAKDRDNIYEDRYINIIASPTTFTHIDLVDGNYKATINAKDGFKHETSDKYLTKISGYGFRTGYLKGSNLFVNNTSIVFKDERNKSHICLGSYSDGNYLLIGSDEKFKISRPADNTEGATITGIKSLTAFANPSATKVFATDGSIADLSTKANTSDLDAKANASDVLLKKNINNGYYIESNSNMLGSKAFATNSTCTSGGNYSFAEGYSTQALGDYSHAEGGYTRAVGVRTHAEGEYTLASGAYSHAEGILSKATGYCTHAEGDHTEAAGYAAHALGAYNIIAKNVIHSVGIGNKATRKNAEYIYAKSNTNNTLLVDDPKNGYKYLIGVGGYDGISTDNSTYKSVQEVIADLTARIEQLETKVRALEAANTPA